MASTNIHSIKFTLGKALTYICDPQKTQNRKLVSSVNCQPDYAEMEFDYTRRTMNPNVKLVAFHAVQSFVPGEVTPEQAHEIGLETMKKWLKDEYEFIIATHVDKNHIHNHIIINSVNCKNGKSFSREHDRKNKSAWLELRQVSDSVVSERGLSVITNPKGRGANYYEWQHKENGTSWKQQLKNIIDETVKHSDNFEDFLQKLRAENIEVKYQDYVKKSGRCLGFRIPGQKYFIYAPKLGWYYEENQINKRIERAVIRRNESRADAVSRRITEVSSADFMKRLYNLSDSRFDNFGMQRWARIQNLKINFEVVNYLQDNGFSGSEEFFEKYHSLEDERFNNEEQISAINEQINFNKYRLKYLKIYREYKEIYETYRNSSSQEKYFRKHENEILLFREAAEQLKKTEPSNKLPNAGKLSAEIRELEEQKGRLIENNKAVGKKLKEYETVKYNLDKITEKDRENSLETQPEQQNSRRKSDNENIELE